MKDQKNIPYTLTKGGDPRYARARGMEKAG